MIPLPTIAETIEEIVREEEPNFLRLYLNPHTANTCLALDRYARTTWPIGRDEDFQSFLANSIEEAISGALKLLRCHRLPSEPGSTGLVLDPADRLKGFASADLTSGDRVEFLPGVTTLSGHLAGLHEAAEGPRINPLVLVLSGDHLLDDHEAALRRLIEQHAPGVITCVDREALAAIRSGPDRLVRRLIPDVIVFDESFADHAVPFAAFTARRSIFAPWNRPGKGTFHSTTFQPNTISARHFLEVLAHTDPRFHGSLSVEMRRVHRDLSSLGEMYRRHFNPGLFRLIRAAGFETRDVRTSGAFIVVNGQPIYDVVGGVACSIRGHNPPTYVEETTAAEGPTGPALEAELRDRLQALTGLGCVLPAVSGAGAVENALKLALVAQFPKRHVLILKSGFGGKTLLALTATEKPSYRKSVGPLYPDVHYLDPFASDAIQRIDAILDRHEFAVVQVELVQSVGGVRPIPDAVLRHLDEGRARRGYLLLVDEVQTGMYRTGPFVRSRSLGLTPDLLLLGKGTSDMVFPFALTLYSEAVADRVEAGSPGLVDAIRRRFAYEQGYRTVVNLLRLAERIDLQSQVEEASRTFVLALESELADSPNLLEIRPFGLLIGIELDASRGPRKWLGKRLAPMALLTMLRHPRFPVLAGLCQYEPNVLKVTPPLDAGPDDLRAAARTMAEVIDAPFSRVLAAGLGGLLKPSPIRRKERDEYTGRPAAELAAR